MEFLNWLHANFYRQKPDRAIARRAVRHMKKMEKTQLFSEEPSQMRAAEGRWYESLIYEMMLDLASKSDKIKYVVKKGADAPFPPIPVKLGQNGIFYSNRGDINIRGNGQDIAEFDIVFVDYMDRICFCEIVTSGSDLKEMEEEVHYKKKLLSYLYAQAVVPFILFSSVDITHSSIMRRLTRETESTLIVTPTCEELKTVLTEDAIKGVPRKPAPHPKVIGIDTIPVRRPFNYKYLHDSKRDIALKRMEEPGGKEAIAKPDGVPPVTKKLLFGAVMPQAVPVILKDRKITISGKEYTYADLKGEFTKMILAMDIPEYEPVIYLRSKRRSEYLKIIRKKTGELKVESKRTPQMTGFFLWLESLKPSIGSRTAKRYVEVFLDCSVQTAAETAGITAQPQNAHAQPENTGNRQQGARLHKRGGHRNSGGRRDKRSTRPDKRKTEPRAPERSEKIENLEKSEKTDKSEKPFRSSLAGVRERHLPNQNRGRNNPARQDRRQSGSAGHKNHKRQFRPKKDPAQAKTEPA